MQSPRVVIITNAVTVAQGWWLFLHAVINLEIVDQNGEDFSYTKDDGNEYRVVVSSSNPDIVCV